MTTSRRRWAWFVSVFGSMAALCQFALGAGYNGVIEEGELGRRIVNIVRDAHRDAGFTGAVLAADKGKVIAAVAVGKVGEKPLEVTSLFELASCTKPFTAVAVMKLAEQGKLKLDDSIADHLPGVPENCRAITVRHLLQHTSGIPRTNANGAGTDLAVVLPTFLEGGPQATPGERHEYWNQGYALLSEVIAQASGKSYTAYCREAIFKPCKMESTRFTGERAPPKVSVAIGRSTRGASRSALEHPYGEYGFQYRGMGGMATSLVDLWRFDRTLQTGKLLKEESIKELMRPGPEGYALGWRINEIEDGHVVQEHSGSVRGFLASIRRDPMTDGALFILANNDDPQPFDLVVSECEAEMTGEKSGKAPKGLGAKAVDELVGVYRDAQTRTLTVSRNRPFVKAIINWHGPETIGVLNLTKTDDLSYDAVLSTRPAKFKRMNVMSVERDEAGKVTGLTISDLKPPLTFKRVE